MKRVNRIAAEHSRRLRLLRRAFKRETIREYFKFARKLLKPGVN